MTYVPSRSYSKRPLVTVVFEFLGVGSSENGNQHGTAWESARKGWLVAVFKDTWHGVKQQWPAFAPSTFEHFASSRGIINQR